MDRMRALEYFVTAAEEGSLTAAAARLDVSVQAVARLVATLERHLGAPLFERGARGLTLTAVGRGYLASCRPLLEGLAAAEELVRGAGERPRGTVVVGATTFTAQHCLVPALPAFRARYPEIDVDLRTVMKPSDPQAAACEVLLVHGWHEALDWVCLELPLLVPTVTVAAPTYWAVRGVPRHPRELTGHVCFCYRNPYDTLLDTWRFQQGDTIESVKVRGWLSSNHRDHLIDAALGGEGVARTMLATIAPHVRSGRLVPVLTDWTSLDTPPLSLMYRPGHRRLPRVRAFSAFATALYRELANAETGGPTTSPRPAWHRWPHERSSLSYRKV